MDGEADPGAITGAIIDRFGGIRPMATKLAVPVTTVQGWKKRGIIPQLRHADILAAAIRENIMIDRAEMAATDPVPAPFSTPVIGPVNRAEPQDAVEPVPAPQAAPVTERIVTVSKGAAIGYVAFVLALAVGIAGAGAGYVGWNNYIQPLQAKVAVLAARPAVGDDIAQRLARLEGSSARPSPASTGTSAPTPTGDTADRLAALEHQLADLKAGAAQTEQLAKGLSDLQIAAGGRELLAQSIRDIQSSTAATQGEVERLTGQVAAFGDRLDKVDAVLADRRQQALRAEATVLAIGQLRVALATSKPFAKEAGAVRAVVQGDTEMNAVLDQIQPFADDGVSTLDDLTRDFGRLAPVLVRSAVVGDGKSWWRQAVYHLESVISIRRVGGDVPGDSTSAVVARAESKLDDGDVSGTISTLQLLTGVPADLASPWIHDALHRVTIDGAVADLDRIAISHLATGKPSAAPPANQSTDAK